MIARIVFAIFIKLSCDGFMFPSFRNNDLLSYSAHELAFKMNLINSLDIMTSDQFSTNNGMVHVHCIVICPLIFVFSPGVYSLFRLFAWRLFVISSFRLASFRYFVFSPGVFSLFRIFAWRLFVISYFLHGVFSLFRLVAWRFFVISSFCGRLFVISSFRMASFRLFVFSRCVLAGRKDEITKKTPREKTKR